MANRAGAAVSMKATSLPCDEQDNQNASLVWIFESQMAETLMPTK
jgi:hypothetical protein